ncbi:MAG: mechanosensitive ion channel family protein [Gemmatimonadales bacterium]|nr:MAG: mechanosensitive ion channel family protein [Gemmatimonadales bacterium]
MRCRGGGMGGRRHRGGDGRRWWPAARGVPLFLLLGLLGMPGTTQGGLHPAAPAPSVDDPLPSTSVLIPAPAAAFTDDPVEQLQAIYRRMPGLQEMEVEREGVVLELRGRALSVEDRDAAIRYAREVIPGVVFVDVRGLVVETDLRRRLHPAMERTREKGMAFLRFVPSLLLGILVVAGGAVFGSWVSRRSLPFRRGDANPFVENLIRQAVRIGVLLLALVVALDLMGIAALVGAVLGAAGVLGIAVGFAFRDIVENYLAGILLSIRQPFAVRDHVRLAGEEGRIVRLTGRETVLMTSDGNHVQIPNATVFKAVITNLTRNPRRRIVFTVGVAPDEELDRAMAVAQDTLEGMVGVLAKPAPVVRVQELADSSVTLQAIAWVDQSESDFHKVRSRAVQLVKEAFEAEGVRTPPPEFGVRLLGSGEAVGAGAPTLPGDSEVSHRAPEGGAKRRKGEKPVSHGEAVDVSPDTTIEEEIEREYRESKEENLLDPG